MNALTKVKLILFLVLVDQSICLVDCTFSTVFPNNTTTAPPSARKSNANDSLLSRGFLTFVQLVSALVMIVGVLGNSLVLAIFGIRMKNLKNCEVFMLSLAIADLVGSIVVPAQFLIELAEVSLHPIGDFGCKLMAWISIIVLTVSALTMLAICVDRFLAVKWPMRERTPFWKLIVTIAAIWLFSAMLGLIYFVGDRVYLRNNGGIHVCRLDMEQQELHIFILVVFCIQVVIPVITMTVMYTLIIFEIHKSFKIKLFEGDKTLNVKKVRLNQQKRATMMMLVVVVAFYVLILPYNLFYLAYTFIGISIIGKDIKALVQTMYLLHSWAMLNASINPIIYSKLHKSFRRNIFQIVASCRGQKFDAKRYAMTRGESFATSTTSPYWARNTRHMSLQFISPRPSIANSRSPSPRLSPRPSLPFFESMSPSPSRSPDMLHPNGNASGTLSVGGRWIVPPSNSPPGGSVHTVIEEEEGEDEVFSTKDSSPNEQDSLIPKSKSFDTTQC